MLADVPEMTTESARVSPKVTASASPLAAAVAARSSTTARAACDCPAGTSETTLVRPMARMPIEISTSISVMPLRAVGMVMVTFLQP